MSRARFLTPNAPARGSTESDRPVRASIRGANRAATIYDVADRAGVSHQTVSRFLKGFAGIRPETQERVRAALLELEYRPNMTARSLATMRSHRIAVLASSLSLSGPGLTVQGLADAARGAGYLVDIVAIDPADRSSIVDAVDLVRQQELAGIIVVAVSDEVQSVLTGVDFGVPVYLDSGPADLPTPAGSSYNSMGISHLVDHLVELGHRDLIHLAGPSNWLAARNRSSAFVARVAHHGLPRHPVIEGDWSSQSGYEAMMSVPLSESVTAVVAANDQMALGAIHALSARGLAVPTDVSVTGFDDILDSAHFTPPLTTTRIDFQRQGRYLFETILAAIENREPTGVQAALTPELVVRGSTAPIRARSE